MATVLKNTPTATQAEADPGGNSRLAPGEVAASPYEEHLLGKVMGAVYQSLQDPKKLRMVEAWLLRSKNLGADVGHIAFSLLSTVFHSAEQAGVKIPVDIFFAQGGAVYQTIDRILLIAEHAGVPDIDQDKVREDALGTVVDAVKQMFGAQLQAHNGPQAPQGAPQELPPAANPLSHAVGQGLQQQSMQQGLLGGQA